jgi:hypothetical protein
MQIPLGWLKVLEGWGVDVEAFAKAFEERIANLNLLPQELLDAVVKILTELGSKVVNPSEVVLALFHAAASGYDPDALGGE